MYFPDYPRVTVGPENPIRVERDDTAELFCEVDSKPRVAEVRWVRDNRFIQTNFRHLIPRANLKDAGPYICNADNGLGQVIQAGNYNFYPSGQRSSDEFRKQSPNYFCEITFRLLVTSLILTAVISSKLSES